MLRKILHKFKIIKLILAPPGDYRLTGMVERLIEMIKQRIAIMKKDPQRSNADLAQIVSKLIRPTKIISNTVTKTKPFEAHFGRPSDTQLSNILTKTYQSNRTYKRILLFFSDKTKFN